MEHSKGDVNELIGIISSQEQWNEVFKFEAWPDPTTKSSLAMKKVRPAPPYPPLPPSP